MNNLVEIKELEGKAVVSSRAVAEDFNKEHYHVVEAIENKVENLTHEKSGVNLSKLFKENTFEHRGNTYKEYLLTRDGFSFIVMGFTGKEADKWKLNYIEAFNQMEESLKQVYHVSEVGLINSAMEKINKRFEDKFTELDDKINELDENYRPTHANKIAVDRYIKNMLGDSLEDGEVEKVKQRVLMLLNADKWQDIPFKTLTENINIIDDSIRAVMSVRVREQMSLL